MRFITINYFCSVIAVYVKHVPSLTPKKSKKKNPETHFAYNIASILTNFYNRSKSSQRLASDLFTITLNKDLKRPLVARWRNKAVKRRDFPSCKICGGGATYLCRWWWATSWRWRWLQPPWTWGSSSKAEWWGCRQLCSPVTPNQWGRGSDTGGFLHMVMK